MIRDKKTFGDISDQVIRKTQPRLGQLILTDGRGCTRTTRGGGAIAPFVQRSREFATSESPERVRQVPVHVQIGRVEEELEERHGAAPRRHLGVGVARLYL